MSNKNKKKKVEITIDLNSVDSVLEHVSVKYKDVKNKEAVNQLQQLCYKLDRKHVNRNTMNLILKERLNLLKGVAVVYRDVEQQDLLDITLDEISIIESILNI